MKSKIKNEIGTFFLILILFGLVTSYLRSEFFPASRSVKFILVIPHMLGLGIAAIVTRLLHRGNLKNMGWKLGKSRFLLLAYFIPLLLPLIAYSFVWITGLGGVTVDRLANLIRKGHYDSL